MLVIENSNIKETISKMEKILKKEKKEVQRL